MTIDVPCPKGNVFRSLGFAKEEAEALKLRGLLAIEIETLIESRHWTQEEAAVGLGVPEKTISDLLHSRLGRITTKELLAMVERLQG
jgi:predicted XRE-type DNA-binding protein